MSVFLISEVKNDSNTRLNGEIDMNTSAVEENVENNDPTEAEKDNPKSVELRVEGALSRIYAEALDKEFAVEGMAGMDLSLLTQPRASDAVYFVADGNQMNSSEAIECMEFMLNHKAEAKVLCLETDGVLSDAASNLVKQMKANNIEVKFRRQLALESIVDRFKR